MKRVTGREIIALVLGLGIITAAIMLKRPDIMWFLIIPLLMT